MFNCISIIRWEISNVRLRSYHQVKDIKCSTAYLSSGETVRVIFSALITASAEFGAVLNILLHLHLIVLTISLVVQLIVNKLNNCLTWSSKMLAIMSCCFQVLGKRSARSGSSAWTNLGFRIIFCQCTDNRFRLHLYNSEQSSRNIHFHISLYHEWKGEWNFVLIKLIGATVRFEVNGWENWEAASRDGGLPIYTFWHNRVFLATYFWRRRRIVVMTSQSFDGEYIARYHDLVTSIDSNII